MELVGTTETGTKVYKNHRAEPYFTFVKNGQKTIECRLNKGLYAALYPGDCIQVYTNDESEVVPVVVQATRTYASFREMLEREPMDKVLPGVSSLPEGEAIYHAFYTKEAELENGVVAIEVSRVEKTISE